MTKITIPTSCIISIVPEAADLANLPRKKKKALKKKLSIIVVKIIEQKLLII